MSKYTNQDLREIAKGLRAIGIRDSEFPEMSNIYNGTEFVIMLQSGRNKKMRFKDFMEYIVLYGVNDIVNVSAKSNYLQLTLGQAVSVVETPARKVGLLITFQDSTDGLWKIYLFRGLNIFSWNDLTKWYDVIEANKPDNEDLYLNYDEGDVLKFADKEYDPVLNSGLGRKYLRKNIVNGLNILRLLDVSNPYTIYIIQYDFDLLGNTITIPEGCILWFQGGSITDGILNIGESDVWGKPLFPGIVTVNKTFKYPEYPLVGDTIYDPNIGRVMGYNGTMWV